VLFLSTGEKTLAEMMGEAGVSIKAGQEVRLIETPADADAGMGLFENIHGFPSPAAFAKHLVALADQVAGIAGEAYLNRQLHEGLLPRRCRGSGLPRVPPHGPDRGGG